MTSPPSNETRFPLEADRIRRNLAWGHAAKSLCAVALTLHCAVILLHVAGLEANNLLQPVSELASDYLSLTGCRQHWAVFSSIPFYHDYRVELEVLDASGRRRSVGPILPSLTAYERGSIRYLKVFEYLAGSEQKLLLSEYLQNAFQRIRARTPCFASASAS